VHLSNKLYLLSKAAPGSNRGVCSNSPWNKLGPEEEEKTLALARGSPELSSRQLALGIMDDFSRFILACELKSDMAEAQETHPVAAPQQCRDQPPRLPEGWI
jgi:hypothetical protein